MFNHFTYDPDIGKPIVRKNLYTCAQKSKSVLEIGVNAGH